MHKTALLFLILSLILLGIMSCRSNTPSAPGPRAQHHTAKQGHTYDTLSGEDRLDAKRGPRVASVKAEPEMRIRIGRSLTTASIGQAGTITVGPGAADQGKATIRRFQAPLRIRHDKQGFVLTQPDGSSVRWRLSSLFFSTEQRRASIDNHPYPGMIELVAVKTKAGQYTGAFDAVNHVGMEDYLPGVLSKELYPGWHEEAYRAQAIAARSYAIWEKSLPNRRARHWDLESTEASQAYVGDKASPKARAAAAATRGQVLVYDGRVLPAVYSSCTGGVGQDATAAWPGRFDDLAPLRGRKHGGWGSNSNRYHWGPVTVPTNQLASGFAQWGKLNKHPIAGLQGLRSITPSATNAVGRPTQFTVIDGTGKRFDLPAESVRNATNTALPGNAHQVKTKAFSSNATYTIAGNTTTIRGKGFGHGVGMCQFGAEQMAGKGHRHTQILGFYYPSTRIQKAY